MIYINLLYNAIKENNYLAVKFILDECKIDINNIDEDGITPLLKCAYLKCENIQILEILLNKGADPNYINDNNKVPIIYYYKKNKDIVNLLVKYGAYVDIVNREIYVNKLINNVISIKEDTNNSINSINRQIKDYYGSRIMNTINIIEEYIKNDNYIKDNALYIDFVNYKDKENSDDEINEQIKEIEKKLKEIKTIETG